VLKSFAKETRTVVRRMTEKAKAVILAHGTYDWQEGDPGKKTPLAKTVVSRAWAQQCAVRGQNYPLLEEHVKYVSVFLRFNLAPVLTF
jgi:hypothetical protein